MRNDAAEIVVAGHLCLDIFPDLSQQDGGLEALMVPGKLVDTGPAVFATGGAVSNTGLAAHRLGIRTSLMGKVANDVFGQGILDVLRGRDPALVDGMIIDENVASSYTVIINVPGVDRIFLHCPGSNDSYRAGDIDIDALGEARLLHFGYPPLMRAIYEDEGLSLGAAFARIRQAGLATSLDMARPDPDSAAGGVNWRAFLERVLPQVDIFTPSIDEILFMVDRDRFDRLVDSTGSVEAVIDGGALGEVADTLLEMGAAVVLLKLGAQGLYLKTTGDADRLTATGRVALGPAWSGCELIIPSYSVDEVSAAGAGDCAIAGFLAAVIRGLAPAEALSAAAACGACNVEAADAISGVRPWDEMMQRIADGWEQNPVTLALNGWTADGAVRRGPGNGR
tara:strand:- start:1032 stop:2216 length:1185 start_codon:yes stop_codon:yes gene_type:complete